jgi:hypothetical protein
MHECVNPVRRPLGLTWHPAKHLRLKVWKYAQVMHPQLLIGQDYWLRTQSLPNMSPDINDPHSWINSMNGTAHKSTTLVDFSDDGSTILVGHRNHTPRPHTWRAMHTRILNHEPLTLVDLTLTCAAHNNNPALVSWVLRHGWVNTDNDGQTARKLTHTKRINQVVLPHSAFNVV